MKSGLLLAAGTTLMASLSACAAPPADDAEASQDRFVESNPVGTEHVPLATELEGETIRVVAQINLEIGDVSTTLGFDNGTGCWVRLAERPAFNSSPFLPKGNRYQIRDVSDERTVVGGLGRNTVVFTLTYAGSTKSPDPNAARIGQDADFKITCTVAQTRDWHRTEQSEVLRVMGPNLQFGTRTPAVTINGSGE